MAKTSSKFVCQQCSYESLRWLGRCPNCDSWNSLVETVVQVERTGRVAKVVKGEGTKPVSLTEVNKLGLKRLATGIEELDCVLGGGIVPGSVTLLAGDPGIGKSTLLLQAASKLATSAVFYISGEESPGQIKIRAERLGVKVREAQNLFFLNETNVDAVIETLAEAVRNEKKPKLVIIDSIQTMWTEDLAGTAGSVGQVRESAQRLLNFAKSNDISFFFVGHVNKEGAIAGPMVLSHLVDTVLFLEGEKYQTLRILRGIKNRFGPTDEVGVFAMEENGLVEVENPSKLFLSERQQKVPGSVVTALMEGSRSILVEVQALVVPTQLAIPRRVGSGVDLNRLQLLVAVLARRAGLPLSNFDIFVNIVGGIKVSEPSADLAICLAIASAWQDKPIDPRVCALGEVGLLGEVRNVGQLEKRIKEGKRLGFTKLATPKEVKNLREAIKLVISN